MQSLKDKAIFLSFDDWHVKEWIEFLPVLDKYGIKATFYIAFHHQGKRRVFPEDIPLIKRLHDEGHTIGCHTWHHLNSKNMIAKWGNKKYIQKEILPCLEALGGLQVQHFSYPYGPYSAESNVCLYGRFDTLRGVTANGKLVFYSPSQIKSHRAFNATDVRNIELNSKQYFDAMRTSDGAVFLYAHNPMHKWMFETFVKLFEFAAGSGIPFLPMSVFDGRRRKDKQ